MKSSHKNIIKTSQYNNSAVLPDNNHSISDKKAKELGSELPVSELEEVRAAFQAAQKIIDAANIYSERHIQEESARMLDEISHIRKASSRDGYADGFEQGMAEGRKAGYEDGYREGTDQALLEGRDLLNKLTNVIRELEAVREDVILKQEHEMTELALTIAETILNQKISESSVGIQSMIDHILEVYQNQDWLNIYVSRTLLHELETSSSDVLNQIKSASKGVRILPGRDLDDSDCIVELPTEVLDVSVSTQLDKIKAALRR